MSKLDEIKRKGFTSDVDVEVNVLQYNWNKDRFTSNLPRNAEKIKAMLRAEYSKVPFVNFNTWILLYKEVDIDSLTRQQLDVYFDEYKLYYLTMNINGRLNKEFSEYSLEDYFNAEVREFTKVGNKINLVDVSKHITIGSVIGVSVAHTSNLIIDRAKMILGENNETYRGN